jgi:hypothetical protein
MRSRLHHLNRALISDNNQPLVALYELFFTHQITVNARTASSAYPAGGGERMGRCCPGLHAQPVS